MLQFNEWKKNCIAITINGDLESGLKPYYVNMVSRLAVQQPDFCSTEAAEQWLNHGGTPPASLLKRGFSKLVWARSMTEALNIALPKANQVLR